MSYLQRLLAYNTWANQGLLAFLRDHPPETLDLTTGGVYGSIGSTFAHLLSSEVSYHRRLLLSTVTLPDWPDDPDLDTLQRMADESAARLTGLIAVLPEADTMILVSDGERAAATILTQLVMHGVEHRAHVGTILGANEIEPPDVDSWAHGIWVHGDAWPADWGPEPAERLPAWGRGSNSTT